MKKTFHLKSRTLRRFCKSLLLCAIGLAAQTGLSNVEYYAAPTAQGSGDGLSAANAASYTSGTLWFNVNQALAGSPVDVNLANGTYTSQLNLTHIGNPVNRLHIVATSQHNAVFSSTAGTYIQLVGSQNIKIDGITFQGSVGNWAINCYPDGRIPVRNILIQFCIFQNLTSSYYGGIGIQDGAREVTVDTCTFSNVGLAGGHAHSIYVSHNVVGAIISNDTFTDTTDADFVRFRDDCEYCTVNHCTFHSTKSSSCYPFISVPMFNATDPGTDPNTDPNCDYFGTYFQISNNSFTYSVSSGKRSALDIDPNDWQPRGLHTALTPSEATTLNSGSTSTKRSFMSGNMAINYAGIIMSGNTYNNVSYNTSYSYSPGDGYGGNGWSGTVNISDVPVTSGTLAACPPIRNGNFAAAGYHMRDWFYDSTIRWHPGFDGTVGAARFYSTTVNQSFWQWLPHTGDKWELDFSFMVWDHTGTGVKFRVDVLNNEYAGDGFSFGVDDQGNIGAYSGGTFTPIPALGTLAFSADGNGDGYVNSTSNGDVINKYMVQLVGNYDVSPAQVEIKITDANGTTFNHTAYLNNLWVGNAPTSTVTIPSSVTFKNYNAMAAVDGVGFNF